MKKIGLVFLIGASVLWPKNPTSARHVIIYKEPGRYAGWPANHGAWQWDNEILVGFEIGHVKATEQYHAIDYTRPEEHVLARSKDGGETWTIEKPEGLRPPPGTKIAGVPAEPGGKPVTDFNGRMNLPLPDSHGRCAWRASTSARRASTTARTKVNRGTDHTAFRTSTHRVSPHGRITLSTAGTKPLYF
jgi:hypothetical protein